MTSRVLPEAEWGRLAGTSLATAMDRLDGLHELVVIVVEDAEGQIVGHVAVFRAVHGEDWWIDPVHRGRAAVLKHLLEAMRAVTSAYGATAWVTHAESNEIGRMLAQLGGARLPGEAFSVPVQKG